MPSDVPLDCNAMMSVLFPDPLISEEITQTTPNPSSNVSADITLCSHSLATSSCTSTVTVMETSAICCRRDAGTSISQLIAWLTDRTSDSTPVVVPCR